MDQNSCHYQPQPPCAVYTSKALSMYLIISVTPTKASATAKSKQTSPQIDYLQTNDLWVVGCLQRICFLIEKELEKEKKKKLFFRGRNGSQIARIKM